MNDLIRKIRGLPEKQQRVLLALGAVASLMGFVAALDEWNDAFRPGFIGATFGALLTNYINYLLGRESGKDDSGK